MDTAGAHYQALLELLGRMLACARNAQWNELEGMQDEYARLAGAVTDLPPQPPVTPQQAAVLRGQIEALLAAETELRALIEPQLAHLSALAATADGHLAQTAGAQRKLAGAYHR